MSFVSGALLDVACRANRSEIELAMSVTSACAMACGVGSFITAFV